MSWIRRETEKGTVQYICPRCHDYHEFREDFGERTFSENYIFCRRCGARNGTGNAPTLTQPNELLTLQDLKAEAKRQGYKLIKGKRPKFERCLCGHNVHQWVSGPEGWAVYCKHCGLYGPWAKKSHNAVIVAWNAMILEKRKGQSHEDV